MFAHLEQLVLHTAEDGAEIDSIHTIEFFHARIGDFRDGALDAGVVECRIEAAKTRNGFLHHRFHLRVIGHVTAYGDSLVSRGDQLLGGRTGGGFVYVRQHHGSALRSKCLRCGQSHAGSGTGDECNFVLKR